jgi:hypothetical protein
MADNVDHASRTEDAELPEPSAEDPRKPYEAPRIMKKRSVNRSTLFTTRTVSSMGLTTMG